MNGKTFNERIIIIILEIFLEFYSISIYDIISTVNSMNRIFFLKHIGWLFRMEKKSSCHFKNTVYIIYPNDFLMMMMMIKQNKIFLVISKVNKNSCQTGNVFKWCLLWWWWWWCIIFMLLLFYKIIGSFKQKQQQRQQNGKKTSRITFCSKREI